MSQLPHSARVEALLAAGRAELTSPTPGVETAPERPTVPRGDATAADPRRAVLDRIAREVMATKQYTAPAVLAMDLVDAILVAGLITQTSPPLGHLVAAKRGDSISVVGPIWSNPAKAQAFRERITQDSTRYPGTWHGAEFVVADIHERPSESNVFTRTEGDGCA